ncbi:Asp-tRNA(Asn)/Glu-tRNA(Gln) amidotransferase subunit GatC [Sandaracinobacter sp. RS1-74]|uniref:Asp-tRNA(Asn)/Glu-tRNA(Gln) amidotransferase subunit GatC n=1 Tax=Sandaracinobacteroides sayramensis TaxID=2913411 RepID=UPI001EDC4ACD|nr:Asp-tRNA(Asn)/Glu-tRNA(Gln) amidotransferase subunit GatC [Sandaracinobacteroides sayramensis]MCG2839407.1 Asp-tRNA(Asn)/Glu-tRNA(Gln) amidotransferase subunit GatC [Sandaracinobacteroides sayramensis]
MAVDESMVARVAGLARLQLAAAEVEPLTRELNNILGWIDQLQAVDTGTVEPMTAVIPLTREWRKDEVTDGDIQQDVLANAPQSAHGFFAVPKVIE